MKEYIKLMRVHHYIKNLLLFVALLFSRQLFDIEKLLCCTKGFIAFCCLSSVIYIINDIHDCEKDRLHPVKCNRPIASGKISIKNAWISAIVLTVITFICNSVNCYRGSTFLLVTYLLLNIAYSSGLKNIPIIDITILVSGFFIRVMYGAVITNIKISNWLYLTVITLALFFSLGKRRNELKQVGKQTREVLKGYCISFLDKNMYVFLTLANVFYALWSMDKNTVLIKNGQYLILTVPIVFLITMKYSLDVEGESSGDPVEVLIHDKILIMFCILYLVVIIFILYL